MPEATTEENKQRMLDGMTAIRLILTVTPEKHCKNPEFRERVSQWSVPPTAEEVLNTQIWAIVNQCVSDWLVDKLTNLLFACVVYEDLDPEAFFREAGVRVAEATLSELKSRGETVVQH